jgi:hypothetical protein
MRQDAGLWETRRNPIRQRFGWLQSVQQSSKRPQLSHMLMAGGPGGHLRGGCLAEIPVGIQGEALG